MFDGSTPGPGRPKGAKDKWKPWDAQYLIDALRAHDFDMIGEWVANYRDPKCATSTRSRMLESALAHIMPKVKAVQHSGTVQHNSMNISMHVQEPVALEHEQTIDASVDMSVMPSISVDDEESDRP